jgi:hypothetical protein
LQSISLQYLAPAVLLSFPYTELLAQHLKTAFFSFTLSYQGQGMGNQHRMNPILHELVHAT